MIKITINTDNAAFEDSRELELARILFDVAEKIQSGYLWPTPHGYPLRDLNGNTVGTIEEGKDHE